MMEVMRRLVSLAQETEKQRPWAWLAHSRCKIWPVGDWLRRKCHNRPWKAAWALLHCYNHYRRKPAQVRPGDNLMDANCMIAWSRKKRQVQILRRVYEQVVGGERRDPLQRVRARAVPTGAMCVVSCVSV